MHFCFPDVVGTQYSSYFVNKNVYLNKNVNLDPVPSLSQMCFRHINQGISPGLGMGVERHYVKHDFMSQLFLHQLIQLVLDHLQPGFHRGTGVNQNVNLFLANRAEQFSAALAQPVDASVESLQKIVHLDLVVSKHFPCDLNMTYSTIFPQHVNKFFTVLRVDQSFLDFEFWKRRRTKIKFEKM